MKLSTGWNPYFQGEDSRMYTPIQEVLEQYREEVAREHRESTAESYISFSKIFEDRFKALYSQDNGCPCVPIRRMVGLLIIKHLRNISDESVVEQWQENVYYQYFCGEQELCVGAPCSATELVEFRKRIGTEGAELILKESIRVNSDRDKDSTGFIDSTVQEKNVTFPTDAKLTKKVIKRCQKLSGKLDLPVRQSYKRVLKDQIGRAHV